MKYKDKVDEIQKEYDSGLSIRDICKKYRMSSKTFHKLNIKTRSISEANKLYSKNNPQRHSLETKEKLSEIRCNALRDKAFYSKREVYNGITLDSSYESKVVRELDANNVRWERPKSLRYLLNGQIRRYIPDFYLPEYDIYLDPKNDYLIKKDRLKISLVENYNDVKVIVLNKDNLVWEKIKVLCETQAPD